MHYTVFLCFSRSEPVMHSNVWNTKGKGKDRNATGHAQEPEAETGPLQLGGFDTSQCRVVRFTEPLDQRIFGVNKYRESSYVRLIWTRVQP